MNMVKSWKIPGMTGNEPEEFARLLNLQEQEEELMDTGASGCCIS